MISVVDRYFSFNRTLLLIIGLWPYEKSKFIRLQIILIFSILISCIIFQLTSILSTKCSAELLIKILSPVLSFTTFIVKYNSFFVNSEAVKCLMEQVQYIYNNIKDNNEIAIVERYGNKAKHYTTVIATAFLFGVSLVLVAQLWRDFTDIILSVNISRPHHLQVTTEYFINQERYFYLLFFHLNTAVVVGCFVLTATGTMLVAYLQHACGMFRIASYRIETAIQIYISKNINMQNEILTYKGIIRAVDIHRKAMAFSTYLITRFEKSFMILIACGVLILAFSIFRILLFAYNPEELMINVAIAFMCFLYMFVANFVGQQIIDYNNHVFITAYKVRWYITPVYVQKLILFLLLRGNKSFGLNVGGLFIASIECFATLANASVSYFTIMYSTRS